MASSTTFNVKKSGFFKVKKKPQLHLSAFPILSYHQSLSLKHYLILFYIF